MVRGISFADTGCEVETCSAEDVGLSLACEVAYHRPCPTCIPDTAAVLAELYERSVRGNARGRRRRDIVLMARGCGAEEGRRDDLELYFLDSRERLRAEFRGVCARGCVNGGPDSGAVDPWLAGLRRKQSGTVVYRFRALCYSDGLVHCERLCWKSRGCRSIILYTPQSRYRRLLSPIAWGRSPWPWYLMCP